MTILTSGVVGGTLVPRQEIRVFAKNQELMELYLQGLRRFQSVDQANPLSWFQIAGIHGRPYIPYDGAGTRSASRAFAGYCTHSSILFPPWHRPYLALFEQTLAKHVTDIANEYTGADKAKYVAAAQQFRIPYWDWAANADLPDFISTQAQVTVNTPSGRQTFTNPLFSYTFHPVYSDFGDGLPNEATWESWRSTLRYPTTQTASGRSNPTLLERTLQNNRLTIRDRTYNLLTNARDYAPFSNDEAPVGSTSPGGQESLESIHNSLHGLTGNNGHMGVVDYAAFDPVFWLHHCNVDRIFALWQALNPTAYVTRQVNRRGNFASAPGTVEDTNTPLAPFWRAQGRFWTSEGARDTRTFNYTYPELVKWAQLPAQDRSRRLRTDINAMYGRTAPVAAIMPELFQSAQNKVSVPFATITGTVAAAAVAPPPTATTTAPAPAPAAPAATKPTTAPASAPAPAPTPTPQVPAPAAPAQAPGSTPAPVPVSAPKLAPAAPAPAPAQKPLQPPTDAFDSLTLATGEAVGSAPKVTPQVAAKQPAEAVVLGKPVDVAGHPAEGNFYYEWVANITVEKYAAKSSFYIHIFLGDFNDDPSKWGSDPNLVGTHTIFANNLALTGCERCKEAAAAHRLVRGTIPLTGALGDKFGADKIRTLTPAQVTPYLQKELHWRIQRHDGSVINRTELPSLKVSVAHFSVKIPEKPDEFPVWGSGENDSTVTVGRPGGAGDD